MRKILCFICAIFIVSIAHADTMNLNWIVDGNVYDTTTCTIGGDIILPTAPNVPGHTFLGWKPLYIPIEYLEFTGTQVIRIPTTYDPLYHHGQIDVAITDISTCNQPILVTFRGTTFFFNSNRRFELWTTSVFNNSKQLQLGTKYHVEYISSPSTRSVSVDGTVASTGGNVASASNNVIAVGSLSSPPYCSYAKIYSLKILDEYGNFIVDLVPVLDGNGTPCMFDKVSNTFFYNQGTGNFIAGPIITE